MQKHKMNIVDAVERLNEGLGNEANALLHGDILIRMEQDEELVFNAEFIERGREIQTEVVLYDNLDIEELYCDCGQSGVCPHIAATLIGADIMLSQDCNDLQSALSAIREEYPQ
ncbi:hypothetical protein SAMN02745823_02433 [Sporobacter termitidis DSM 10068]|uniref:SWIM-type domain-containing protein n=1 Tax=Sporobacter termitidis DSM 10068 TaxID=1123282 RepID=A0A1M5YEJ5_9FIRM|nr:SWIM zinc finger family protein [Sporobacter termitidis]SHI10319.1 hypothetical protein SAMN02745823_02433 [Sporobacter termitidis DSM 10068]